MTKEEYSTRLKKIESDFLKDKHYLQRDYAFSNSHLDIGDIVTDHIGSIKIEEIWFCTSLCGSLPMCVYSGQTLKKDGTETKKKEKRNVYQSNIKM